MDRVVTRTIGRADLETRRGLAGPGTAKVHEAQGRMS